MALNTDNIYLIVYEIITPGNPTSPATMSLIPPTVGKTVVMAASEAAAIAVLAGDVSVTSPAVLNVVKCEQIPTTDGGYHA